MKKKNTVAGVVGLIGLALMLSDPASLFKTDRVHHAQVGAFLTLIGVLA